MDGLKDFAGFACYNRLPFPSNPDSTGASDVMSSGITFSGRLSNHHILSKPPNSL
jgi:hypothetical protein